MAKAAKKSAKKSSGNKKITVKTKTTQKKSAGPQSDILKLIVEEHKPLKQMIKVLKDSEKNDLEDRKAMFEEFAVELISHAKPEEKSLYAFMRSEEDLREDSFEGDVEHGLADQLIEEIKRTEDDDMWSARVKVLAELVEHHIKEEEEDMFPEVRKHADAEKRAELAQTYMEAKAEFLAQTGGVESPSEKNMTSKEKRESRVTQ